MPFGSMHTTIRLTVVAVFVLATLLTASLATGLQYYFGQSMAREAAAKLYATASSGIAGELRSVGKVNANVIALLADNPALLDPAMQGAHLETFIEVLRKNPLYYGIYLGAPESGFYEVINLDTSARARKILQAGAEDRWLVITVQATEKGLQRHYHYLDNKLNTRLSRSEATDYQVIKRPWYKSAISSDTVQLTPPYHFAQLNIPGRTISKRIGDSNTVVAIDMTLSTISRFLRENRVSDHGAVFIFGPDGQVIASSMEQKDKLPGTGQFGERSTDKAMLSSATASINSLTQTAANTSLHGKLMETRLNNKPYFSYVAPVGAGENSLFMGILSPRDKVLAPYLDKVKWSIWITIVFLLLLLPFSWLFANPIVRPIKQLALENDKVQRREYDQVNRVSSHVKELDDLSNSMVDMVAAIQAHEVAQRKLMDSFIELIAAAIDDKSSYTGGHCERVPELAMMLAQQASESALPAFTGFSLETEDEWREYRIAAWLHDCGKITTPEHIVDKGSKLEAIYNRIHEVRMRFEVLWRDAEIDYWKKMAQGQGEQADLARELDRIRDKLQQDFAFVAQCNVGGEFLDEEKQDRLRSIAGTRWQRYFSDRIGLSPLEELRQLENDEQLPATELLLSDKAEHIVEREQSTNYPPELGIDMDVPEHLYNLGEVYNLSISRGTLTAEDRFKINEHMISTIKMLESLPFPDELKNVPRYASTHHETMRGSGYPRKLEGSELSIPERILAIADIFEALTASDRPYKKAKPISVALSIMHQMVLDQHIDKDCFELFVRNGVYRDYAMEFLPDDQLDAVEINSYLSE